MTCSRISIALYRIQKTQKKPNDNRSVLLSESKRHFILSLTSMIWSNTSGWLDPKPYEDLSYITAYKRSFKVRGMIYQPPET